MRGGGRRETSDDRRGVWDPRSHKRPPLVPPSSQDSGSSESESDDDVIPGIEDVTLDDTSALQAAVDAFTAYRAQNPSATVAQLLDSAKNQQMASALKTHMRVHIVMRSVVGPDFFKGSDVADAAPLLAAVVGSDAARQRHAVSNAEDMFKSTPALVPVLLKQLYDADVLEEEAILLWAGEEDGNEEFDMCTREESEKVREKCKPLVEWLEEESDDEEEGEDED